MTKVFEDGLVLDEDKTFEESIKVQGDIKRKEVRCPDLTVKGDIDAWNIDAANINARNIVAADIDAWNIDAANINARNIDAIDIVASDINAWNIDAANINARNIDAEDISYHGFCIGRKGINCTSIEGRRENSVHKGLDNGITFKEEPEKCPECGQEIEVEE